MIKLAARGLSGFRSMFGRYIAAEPNDRRRDPGTRIRSSDAILDETKRKRVIEGGRELWRNYSVAAWAIRKHLDYVSTFTFQAATENPKLNQELESLMKWWSRRENCDVARRHPMRRIIRLLELRRTIDGDVWPIKLVDGRLQIIEGDRVRNPERRDRVNIQDVESLIHGVRLGPGGEFKSIAVHKRHQSGRYEFEREVAARNFYHLGYFDGFDQVRGVSPLAAAIAHYQDAHEVSDYALAKAKVTQLFALAITRQMADGDDYDEAGADYDVDFGKGPIQLDLDPGDEASFLESKHPSTEFQAFLTMTLQAALKSLDIPWSFYDEGYTNFFGSKAALIQYQLSAKAKRDDLKDFLDHITGWRIAKWVARGALTLPRGWTVGDLNWDWIPGGVPWWDTQKEVAGEVAAIEAGLKTRSEVRRERHGDDWRDVVRKLKEEKDFLKEQGLLEEQAVDQQATQEPQAGTEETLRERLDTYGLAVRAGVITPIKSDEEYFRGLLELPPVSSDIAAVWSKEPTRRPVTLAQVKEESPAPMGEPGNDDTQSDPQDQQEGEVNNDSIG